ncbi:MAG: ribonuclease R [Woeseiaceae bacterium]|nr:ribonuclease R [Woeseiaceae bacterium]
MAKRKKTTSRKARGKNYKHPIPGRNELLDYLKDVGQPLKAEAILSAFDLKGLRLHAALLETLQKMVRAGQIIQNRRGEFCLTEKLELLTGTVSGHSDGFGFVRRDDGDEDVYLSAREMRSLIDGDRVAIKLVGEDRRGRLAGRVVEVLERGLTEVAGQFIRERGIGIVVPDNPKISHRFLIPKGEASSAKPGQIVIARILDYPTDLEQPTGKVIRVIGGPEQKGIATDIAIHSHGIPTIWPKDVRQSATKLGRTVPADGKKGRLDLRDTPLVTIDGADARDFDDAVFCAPSGIGWRLVVAIADVGHYVEKGTPLDQEAIKRGTSVYFPDRVVPMLPEVLSNGLGSLKPKVDRLCMVCDMKISTDGKVTRSKFYEGLMRSAARLTYEQVNGLLSNDAKKTVPGSLHKPLRDLHDLYKALAKARRRRGAIELDIPQTRIKLDDKGAVKSIESVPRNDAHRLIEECMIAANVQAAKFLRRHRIAALYRIHAKPDPDRFDDLRQYLLSLGLKVPHSEHVEPRQFNQILTQVQGRPDAQAISMVMLRSLAHAEYSPRNIGHFGLSLDAYAHFTSPIRRYPDLLVHRAIRHIVRGGKAGSHGYDGGSMERLGAISSAHERRAEDATREVEAWLKCQFMADKIGDDFDGRITGVTNFGVFVQLPDLQIDGLVHVTSLPNDYYHFQQRELCLVGERTGKRYGLGDQLRVTLARVDLDSKRIDFRLSGENAKGRRVGRRSRR